MQQNQENKASNLATKKLKQINETERPSVQLFDWNSVSTNVAYINYSRLKDTYSSSRLAKVHSSLTDRQLEVLKKLSKLKTVYSIQMDLVEMETEDQEFREHMTASILYISNKIASLTTKPFNSV